MRDELQHLNAEVEDRHWWFVGRRAVLTVLIHEVLPPARGPWTVLDVGCGTGANLGALGPEYRRIGFDTSSAAAAHARRRFPELEIVQGDSLAAVAAQARSADLILLTDVLEHVEDDKGMLTELVGMAQPGAWVLVTVPANPALWSEHDVSHSHYRRYTRESLESVWRDLPVEIRLHCGFNSRLYPLALAVRHLSRLRRRAAGLAGTDLVLPVRPLNALLASIFAGEAGRVVRTLRRGEGGYEHGLSRIALLRVTAPASVASPEGASQEPPHE